MDAKPIIGKAYVRSPGFVARTERDIAVAWGHSKESVRERFTPGLLPSNRYREDLRLQFWH